MIKYGFFALATLIFYFLPLFDAQTSIQGDAADLHYPAQKYFADCVREGHLPHWTPFLYSGFPFLADPHTGAWYPLQWPFFLIGITPRAIEWELALHAFLALCGTYLLARRLMADHALALLAGVFYAGGGYFAGYSSHVGMFETAALLPGLLWAGLRALDLGCTIPSMLVAGTIGGLIVLIGDFQGAIYSFFALALLVIARRPLWVRGVALLASAAGVAMLLGAIQILPAMELAAQSIPAAANTPLRSGLATLLLPNSSGPFLPDSYQLYFYSGILFAPLAIVGVVKGRGLVPSLLIGAPLLFAFGVSIRIWFVASLGMALAAACGASWLAERFRKPWLMTAILVVTVADVWYWNMADNPLAYATTSFAEKYGDPFTNFEGHLASAKARPFFRIWSPFDTNTFGPLDGSLNGRTEVTYGYNPLELSRYHEYLQAVEQNPRLLNGLAVTHGIDTQRGAMIENTNVLPRIYAPTQVKFVAGHIAARGLLATLDSTQWAIVEAPLRPLASGPTRVEIVNYGGDSYRAKYSAPFDCLLRIAVPYFPGWTASIDGKPAEVVIVDNALSGVFAPAGDHELIFRYRSNWFLWGAIVSALTALGIILPSISFLRRR